MKNINEIVIGLVCPIGCHKDPFKSQLEKEFKEKGYYVENINLTNEIFKSNLHFPKSFEIFLKMQACSSIREKSRGATSAIIIEAIQKIRKKITKDKKTDKIVYIIDQLKNLAENEILKHVYGQNFVQISLFSNKHNRDDCLKSKLSTDKEELKDFLEKKGLEHEIMNKTSSIIKTIKDNRLIKFSTLKDDFKKEIMSDCCHKLMDKDYNDPDTFFKNTGQQLSKLFHKSHYFINLDLIESKLNQETKKFIDLFLGKYDEYPTQDEFGINIAYQAGLRSNFPGERQIGAAIISNNGEVISVASIRSPTSSANTLLSHKDSIQQGYTSYKDRIKNWGEFIDKSIKSKKFKKEDIHNLECIKKFLSDSLDFHPCTHAELSAIIDAAKMGVSLRKSTLYTTTFPCHLCAKDIITAGIERVVYLEAYPKSKSEELYPNNIDFHSESKEGFIPFDIFFGVSPESYSFVYSLDNKKENHANTKNIFPFLKYESSIYYHQKENDIVKMVKNILKKSKKSITKDILYPLLK